MAVKFFILAGPQAAGKSTIKQAFSSQVNGLIPLEEARQIIVHKHQRKGAIFMTRHDEIDVIHFDMTRMFDILHRGPTGEILLDETNVFTLGHARAHGIDLLEGYFRQYVDLLTELGAGVIFVDVPPQISWERRQPRYAERLWDLQPEEKHRIMVSYREYLEGLHTELLAIFDRLDLAKVKINAVGAVDETVRRALEAFGQLNR